MLTKELSRQSLPQLSPHDKIYRAAEMMNEHQVTCLPITEGDKYIGLITEDDLMQAENDHDELQTLQQSFAPFSVHETDHFLKALQVAADHALSVVPVVNEDQELTGTVTYNELIRQAAGFMNLQQPGALIVLELDPAQYSFQEISKVVESNDAQITQLNSSVDPVTGLLQVTIRINKAEVSDLISSFQRYEYNVKYFFGEEIYANEIRTNYDNLMHYLKI